MKSALDYVVFFTPLTNLPFICKIYEVQDLQVTKDCISHLISKLTVLG